MGSCGSKEISPGPPANIEGGIPGSSADPKNAVLRSKEIDRQIADERGPKEIKILLLGTAETGKSTVLKQLRIIHGGGFTDDDVQLFRSAVRKNIFDTVKILMDAMEALQIPYGFDTKELDPKKFSAKSTEAWRLWKLKEAGALNYKEPLPKDLLEAIKLIWNDPGVQYCFSRSNEFQIVDLSYFMQDVDKFNSSEHTPTNQDILSSRIMTSGVSETKVTIKGIVFKVFDVGGQRNERRKWIHVFDNVNSIFFLVDVSSFNQVTVEDTKINRIVESITVFSFICNHPSFKKTSIIIFMNKIDLLKEKLEGAFIKDYFPEYEGSNDHKEGAKFFGEKIASFNKQLDRQLYFHYTQANDTSKMKVVLATVIESILVNNLQSAGLM
ncbi:guanine nucleotide binding protein, alpha inhibiting 3, isoform CRA_a [Obelidium mucronatum]|nr:guanine nucleotide binding protein, alpha inhibiting 3, isoform CRA_a [Obelidium mucronatum]